MLQTPAACFVDLGKQICYTGHKEGFAMGWDGNEDLWLLLIFGLIGLGIGAYYGYQEAGVWFAIGGGIVGFIGGAFFYALSGGISRPKEE